LHRKSLELPTSLNSLSRCTAICYSLCHAFALGCASHDNHKRTLLPRTSPSTLSPMASTPTTTPRTPSSNPIKQKAYEYPEVSFTRVGDLKSNVALYLEYGDNPRRRGPRRWRDIRRTPGHRDI
jgi:hypothetical protein